MSGSGLKKTIVKSLRGILEDTAAPAAARASAGRTLAEMEGLLGRHAQPPAGHDAPPSTLDGGGLASEIARLQDKLSRENS